MANIDKNIGDSVEIGITVMNTGNMTGTWTLSYSIDGDIQHGSDEYKQITLAPGENTMLNWSWVIPYDIAGTGLLNIYYDIGTKYYPDVLTNFIASTYSLVVAPGVPVLEISNIVMS